MAEGQLTEFEKELSSLLNKHGKDAEAGTPDFILARFLSSSLEAYTDVIQTRGRYYGIGV